MSVKARGNFMEVEEPKYAKTILGCDLNVNANKMIAGEWLYYGHLLLLAW